MLKFINTTPSSKKEIMELVIWSLLMKLLGRLVSIYKYYQIYIKIYKYKGIGYMVSFDEVAREVYIFICCIHYLLSYILTITPPPPPPPPPITTTTTTDESFFFVHRTRLLQMLSRKNSPFKIKRLEKKKGRGRGRRGEMEGKRIRREGKGGGGKRRKGGPSKSRG